MRDWLTLIIVLLILGIVLDGIRRMRAQRRASLQMGRDLPDPLDDLDDDFTRAELPRGGARPAARQPAPPPPQQVEPTLGDFSDFEESLREPLIDAAPEPPPEPVKPKVAPAKVTPRPAPKVEPKAEAKLKPEPKADAEAGLRASTPPAAPDEVLIINVMAKPGQEFYGVDLLEALLDSGMRFGEMDIFHRHQGEDGFGPVLFSLANMLKPGTFDLHDMDSFTTPGVCLFLTLPIKGESLAAYDLMVTTAQALAARLDGELKDENRSVMTRQTIEHGRQRVVEYERKRRLARA